MALSNANRLAFDEHARIARPEPTDRPSGYERNNDSVSHAPIHLRLPLTPPATFGSAFPVAFNSANSRKVRSCRSKRR